VVGTGLAGEIIDGGFQVLDDGAGARLYFTGTANGSSVRFTRRLVNASWVSPPDRMFVNPDPNPGDFAQALCSTTVPRVSGLYGVYFPYQGAARYVARWSGAKWVPIGAVGITDGIGYFHPMIGFNDTVKSWLVVSGAFQQMSGVNASFIARWDGRDWYPMGAPPAAPTAFCIFDDGTGPSLYMGFNGTLSLDPLKTQGVARWNGTAWVSVGGGTNRTDVGYGGVNAMAVFDDGSGPALFVAGSFNRAGGIPALQIAKWDGHQWSALGAGISGYVKDMAVANDGRGDSLFICGGIFGAGGGTGADIVQWVGCRGQCYANCDNSTASPRLNVNDFMCFLDAFARHEPYANCTVDAIINAADFICFMNKFAAGCP